MIHMEAGKQPSRPQAVFPCPPQQGILHLQMNSDIVPAPCFSRPLEDQAQIFLTKALHCYSSEFQL